MSVVTSEEQPALPQELQDVAYSVVQLLQAVLPSECTISPVRSRDDAQNSFDASPNRHEAHNDAQEPAQSLEIREKAGADLWDLAQSEEAASITVDHMGLDILPQVVTQSIDNHNFRIAELLLGALANILCHPPLAQAAATHQALQQAIAELAFSTSDATCLSETFRLMTVAVKGAGSKAWLAVLLDGSRHLLRHVIWIADNTLNSVLYERCSALSASTACIASACAAICRSLDLLLAILYQREQSIQAALQAGIMPIFLHAMQRYNAALQADSTSASSEGSASRGQSPSGPALSPSAVVALLSLCEVFAQHPDEPLFTLHSRPLCLAVLQMLALHEMLHQKATTQSLLVVILACLDSKLWLQELSKDAQAVAAVLEVLQNDYGFDDELEEAEAEQGQEAAWAVMAAVSKYMAKNEVSNQIWQTLLKHADILTKEALAAISDSSAVFTWQHLLQAIDHSRNADAEKTQQTASLEQFGLQLNKALQRWQITDAHAEP